MSVADPVTWVVLPTYNEAENIERLVAELRAILAENRRILIVDDGSPDGTGKLADLLAAEHDDVAVLHRPIKLGLGPAYVAGFRRALDGGADLIVQMDADFSHAPADVPRLLEATRDADLALGSRYVDGGRVGEWGVLRRLISRGGSAYARAWLGLPIRDLTGGFKCFRRDVLEVIRPETVRALGYAFQVETTFQAIKAGFRVAEIPIVFNDRRVGESKMSRAIIAEAIWRVPAMRLRSRARRR